MITYALINEPAPADAHRHTEAQRAGELHSPQPAALTTATDEQHTNEQHAADRSSDAKALVAQTLAGDLNAFNQLVLQLQSRAYRTACYLLKDEESAADVVQDSFLKAWQALSSYRGGDFASWFMRILVNRCYDRLRSQQRWRATSLDELTESADDPIPDQRMDGQPAAHAERMELQQWLQKGLGLLPLEQRTVVLLYDVEGYSYEEIAQITQVPLGTIKSRLSRGRGALRDYLVRHHQLYPTEGIAAA